MYIKYPCAAFAMRYVDIYTPFLRELDTELH